MDFLRYLLSFSILGIGVLILVRCFLSVRREPSTSKLTAIIAALLVCIALALASPPSSHSRTKTSVPQHTSIFHLLF